MKQDLPHTIIVATTVVVLIVAVSVTFVIGRATVTFALVLLLRIQALALLAIFVLKLVAVLATTVTICNGVHEHHRQRKISRDESAQNAIITVPVAAAIIVFVVATPVADKLPGAAILLPGTLLGYSGISAKAFCAIIEHELRASLSAAITACMTIKHEE